MLDLLGGHRVTAALCTAVELGVVEALTAGERTATEVANECSTHAPSTERLLIALVALGICQSVGPTRYRLTDMGACLANSASHSLRSWALFEGKMLSHSWMGLAESVRSGRTAAELAGADGGRYGQMHRDPEAALVFDAAMANMTRLVARDLIAAGDFNSAGKVLDVGGGAGTLLVEILRACPTTSGSILDLERCEAAARRAIDAAGMRSRASFLTGDFFAGIPAGFDTLLLKNVLHNWDDERCVVLLANCRSALADAGRIVIAERFLPPRDYSSRSASTALGDLNMLRGPGGRERSEAAYCGLVTSAGLRVARRIPAGRYDLLVATR
nr:methyltransferase [Bradyrhizobium sp. AUGA SZCCT0222]